MSEARGVADGLWLDVESLFSKWGFNDGDEPDYLWDWLDEQGIGIQSFDWHIVLRRLVREFLLPALDEPVTAYDIDSIHNPIRCGIDDEGVLYDEVDGVLVPWETVFTYVREEVGK